MEYPALRRIARDGGSVAAAEATFALDVIDLARAKGITIEQAEQELLDIALLNILGAPTCQP